MSLEKKLKKCSLGRCQQPLNFPVFFQKSLGKKEEKKRKMSLEDPLPASASDSLGYRANYFSFISHKNEDCLAAGPAIDATYPRAGSNTGV